MQRKIIQFATVLNHGRRNEARPVVTAYQLRNGMAAGHPVRQDEEGNFKYGTGWEIYHVATGALVSPGGIFGEKIRHATPAAAMLTIKNKFKGKLLGKLRAREDGPALSLKGLTEVIGKLKAWPKPAARLGKVAPGCERVKVQGNSALFALIAEIDAALADATKTSKLFCTFKFGRATFKISRTFARLKNFRAQVLKNRRAFADSALPKIATNKPAATLNQPKGAEAMTAQPQTITPAVDRALAVLRASLGNVQPAAPQPQAAPVAAAPAPKPQPRPQKAVAHAKKPAPARAKPAHDVWYYFGQQKARAERRAA